MALFDLGNFSVGTLTGIAVGAFLGHALAVRRGKTQKQFEAAVQFRKAILPALIDLEKGKSQFSTIQGSFDNHVIAAREYAAFLTEKKRSKFLSALQEYEEWRENLYGRDREETLYETEAPDYVRAKNTNPIHLLRSMLSYAPT